MNSKNDGFLNPYKVLGVLETSEKLKDWVSQKRYPVHVKFDLTGACNLHCIFCSGVKMQDDLFTNSIPWKVLSATLKDLTARGTRAVTFTGGGEPLLYPHIDKCLELTCNLGLEFGITTNASLPLSPSRKAALAHALWIRASVNAGSSRTYQVVHNPRKFGEETYHLVMQNLQEMRKICPSTTRLGCSYLIETHNWSEIVSFANQIRDMGLDYVQFKLAYIPAEKTMFDVPEYRDHATEIFDLLEQVYQLETDNFKIIFPKGRAEFATKKYQSCWVQHFSAHVGVNSHVYPCCVQTYHPQADLGSLIEHTFEEIWHSETRQKRAAELGASCPRCWWDPINTVLDIMANPMDDMDFI